MVSYPSGVPTTTVHAIRFSSTLNENFPPYFRPYDHPDNMGVSNCDAANMLEKASYLRLVQRLRRLTQRHFTKTPVFCEEKTTTLFVRDFYPQSSPTYSLSFRNEMSPQYFLLKLSHYAYALRWLTKFNVLKKINNNEETEDRDESSESGYTNGDDKMMEVEKQSIRKSEAERDIGNERERGKISDILSLTDLYFKGNQYTL
jgi:hypothetical protein